jgi:hypothetical protein
MNFFLRLDKTLANEILIHSGRNILTEKYLPF